MVECFVLRAKLGAEVCDSILFVHAISGCDTTSRLYGISKPAVLSLFVSNETFRSCSKVFYDSNASRDQIVQAGEQAVLLLYKATHGESLAFLRLRLFNQQVAHAKCFVKPQTLPPTSAALVYHNLRVYLQVRVWQGHSDVCPRDWGWKLTDNNKYFPVMTILPPAPTNHLKIIHCNYKSMCDAE